MKQSLQNKPRVAEFHMINLTLCSKFIIGIAKMWVVSKASACMTETLYFALSSAYVTTRNIQIIVNLAYCALKNYCIL